MLLIFLYTLYKDGCSYSKINTARSALSTVVLLPGGHSFSHHPLVTIHSLKISGINMSDDRGVKTCNPGKHQEPLVFKAYTPDSAFNVLYDALNNTLRTEGVRNGGDRLWLNSLC